MLLHGMAMQRKLNELDILDLNFLDGKVFNNYRNEKCCMWILQP